MLRRAAAWAATRYPRYTAFEFYLPGARAYTDRYYESRGIDPADVHQITLVSWPGGNTGTARHFVKAMIPDSIEGGNELRDVLWGRVNWQALDRPGQQVRIRLDATAVHIEHNGKPDRSDVVNVVYHKGGRLYRVRARSVVMASGGWVNKRILRDLPMQHREAYQQFYHAPILTVNVAVRNWQYMERLGITAAQWFSGFGWYTNLRRQMLIDGKAESAGPCQTHRTDILRALPESRHAAAGTDGCRPQPVVCRQLPGYRNPGAPADAEIIRHGRI